MKFDLNKVQQAAAQQEDMTQSKAFERYLPPEGPVYLRLVEYIELGKFKPNNPTHKPSQKAILTFELFGKKYKREDGEGKPIPATLQVRLNKGTTAKSGFRKLFNLMNAAHGGVFTHMAEMVGLEFKGRVYHNKDGETTYANLDKDGAYSISAAVKEVEDDEGNIEEQKIIVPQPLSDLRLFLWENDALEDQDVIDMWDDLFIEGSHEEVDEKTKEKTVRSKNWIQDLIMTNLDWEGSRTQALTQEFVSLDDEEEDGSEGTLEGLKANAVSASEDDDDLPSLDDD